MAIATALPPAPARPVGGGQLFDSRGTFELIVELAFSGNYVAGGEVVAPTFESYLKSIGAGNVLFVTFSPKAGYTFEYDYVNKKVLVKQGGAAVSNPEAEIGAAAYPGALSGLAAGNRVRAFVKGV